MGRIKLFRFVIFMEFSILCHGLRRVRDGKDVTKDKTYAVYLVKAEPSKQKYDEWLCGGAIVNKWFIVTSAACVEDVKYMYAIAGYKKMILYDKLNEDACTRDTKKRIVFICVPKSYEFEYANITKWATVDIAVVKVESAYNFNDPKYETLCSYKPTQIDINYEFKYQEPGTDVLIMGWGHATKWRSPSDTNIYNAETLKIASALIASKNRCKQSYENLDLLIDKYMICVSGDGNLNDNGDLIQKITPVFSDGCCDAIEMRRNGPNNSTRDIRKIEVAKAIEENKEEECEELQKENESPKCKKKRKLKGAKTRRDAGICQNDHGSPIVTWRGAQEILIGVASVFRVLSDGECTGPYLFTSTHCNGIFLDCVINEFHKETLRTSRSDICHRPPKERGFDFIRREISWHNHLHGLTAKEMTADYMYHIARRPQIPMSYFG